MGNHPLVGGFNDLEKYEFVKWDDDIPHIVENKIHVWNHQPGDVCWLINPMNIHEL